MKGRIFRLAALLAFAASSSSLVFVLAACGGTDGGSAAGSQLGSQSQRTVRSDVTCPDIVLCILGTHWDTSVCRCVPNEDDAGTVADSADEAAADAGSVTPEAGSDAGDEDEASSCPGH
ncbi:MAG TPA: hypothetical protein VF765_14660 [Polyangiaceae bacterium]